MNLTKGIGLLAVNYPDGTEIGTNILILGIVMGIIWALIIGMFSYYLYKFHKNESQAKIYGKTFLLIVGLLGTLLLFTWLTIIIIYSLAGTIFNSAHESKPIVITLSVIGGALLLAIIVLMWFWLPKFGIAFDKEKILYMGENIPYMRIKKIILDENKGAVFIFFTQGKRTVKRQKFSTKSIFGQFIIKHGALSGHEVESLDADQYFKSVSVN